MFVAGVSIVDRRVRRALRLEVEVGHHSID